MYIFYLCIEYSLNFYPINVKIHAQHFNLYSIKIWTEEKNAGYVVTSNPFILLTDARCRILPEMFIKFDAGFTNVRDDNTQSN